jgi:hypothetical protein
MGIRLAVDYVLETLKAEFRLALKLGSQAVPIMKCLADKDLKK